jgi:pyruvate/2-oxoglutarate dehydrogenase complex dihydrolipoamide acyltransferase (E2) component
MSVVFHNCSIIYGREAVTFLVRVKQCIEDPTRMLLDA